MSKSASAPVTVAHFSPRFRNEWEQVVTGSPSGHLMARLGYFQYHADRFQDHSLIFLREGRLLAVLPANRTGETLWSHQGVSFGGLILSRRTRFQDTREIVAALRDHLGAAGFARLLYRPAPFPYQQSPREDDLYCLRGEGAEIVDTKLHAMLVCGGAQSPNQSWRQECRTALATGLKVGAGTDVAGFWPHVEGLLRDRADQKPVHTLDEILLLASRFPREMRLLETRSAEGRFLAGQLFLVSGTTITCLYVGETPEGRACGASRVLMDHLMHAPEFKGFWLDTGQWTDTDSREESASLLAFKEASGARLIQRHTWELKVS